MIKLSHLLRSSRSAAAEKFITGKIGNATNAFWTHNFMSQAETGSSKFFANYTVFKGKAALSCAPSLPSFKKSESSSKYDKKGCVFLTFWPCIGERKYDWEKRQVFALSPTELGSLISLEPGNSCKFMHDPSMKSSNAGQIIKQLSVTPKDGGDDYLFSLNVVNNSLKTNERFSVPVSKAEFTVMLTGFSFILPHIMGWSELTKQVPASSGQNPMRQQEMPASSGQNPTRQQEMPPSLVLEWNR